MKVLNLYAGIGGNRKLWEDVEVTAVEWDKEIASIYQDFFPNDKVIITDAHQYLLEHFKRFDFIWSSPPCPSHSRFRFMTTKLNEDDFTNPASMIRPIIYPDMKLYQEILLLQNYFNGKWVVENVKPYYEPLIKAKEISRHLFWANFNLNNINIPTLNIKGNKINDLEKMHGFSIRNYKLKNTSKITILRNCVHPKLGEHILNCARNIIKSEDVKQQLLF